MNRDVCPSRDDLALDLGHEQPLAPGLREGPAIAVSPRFHRADLDLDIRVRAPHQVGDDLGLAQRQPGAARCDY
jgi:hypothetical protein